MTERLRRNRLFIRLKELEALEFDGLSTPLSTNIIEHLIPVSEKLLQRIPAFMPEYTLHDLDHCLNILDNVSNILPNDVELNIVEIYILIQAIFLHDIGMVINTTDANKLKSTLDFDRITLEFEKGISEDEILTEYIRRTHVDRSLEYVDQLLKDYGTFEISFKFKQIDISDWVKSVIRSHSLPVSALEDTLEFPVEKLVQTYKVNVQFLSILLRLGDILDFDIYRTPYFLYKHINPKNKISVEEWKKHQSIEGRLLTESSITISGKCSSASIYRSVLNFTDWIEKERVDSINLLKKNPTNYQLNLTNSIAVDLRTDGSFIYTDLKIHLEYEKVLGILMGTELYESPDIFIRELIQNSYDACKYRKSKTLQPDIYEPSIIINFNKDLRTLEITDNGSGMDSSLFEQYVIKIGRSFYQSKFFESQHLLDFTPISNFGIGILSCFMVSDTIEIESLRFGNDSEKRDPIHYILSLDEKYIDQQVAKKQFTGTTIRLRLKEDYIEKLEDQSILTIIKDNMMIHDIPIQVNENGISTTLNQTAVEIPEDLQNIANVEIIHIDKDLGVQGYLALLRSDSQSLKTSQNLLAVQGFNVIKKNGQNIILQPEWLEHFCLRINVEGRIKIHLKASRNSLIEDENLSKVREIISDTAIDHFNTLLSTVDPLNFRFVFSGSIRLGHRVEYKIYSQKEYDFLLNAVSALILDKKFSKFQPCTIAKIISSKIKSVCVIHQNLIINNLHNPDFKEFLKRFEAIVIEDPYIGHFYHLLNPITTSRKMHMSKFAGVAYEKIDLDPTVKLKYRPYQLDKLSKHSIWPCIAAPNLIQKGKPIFCAITNRHTNGVWLEINFEHKLGEILIKNSSMSYCRKFFSALFRNLAYPISDKINNKPNKIVDKFEELFDRNDLTHLIPNFIDVTGHTIGFVNPTFLTTLNTYIENNILKPLIAEGKIDHKDYADYLLTIDDFPHWWFI